MFCRLCSARVVLLIFFYFAGGYPPFRFGFLAIHTFAGQPSRRSIGPAVGVSGFAMWRSLGVRGLCWSQVLPTAISISHSVCGPVALVIHARGNDVGLLRMDEFLMLMRADLECIRGFFQDVMLVWSELDHRVT